MRPGRRHALLDGDRPLTAACTDDLVLDAALLDPRARSQSGRELRDVAVDVVEGSVHRS